MQYSYRFLEIEFFDKHPGNDDRRRGGDKPDRYLRLRDSTLAEAVFFNDERGDDNWDFLARARNEFVKYLDALGSEGWQVSYYSADPGLWPVGIHFLIRSEA